MGPNSLYNPLIVRPLGCPPSVIPFSHGFSEQSFGLSLLLFLIPSPSRYSTSTLRSFNSDALQPRLHSQFGEETSINSIANGFEPEQESFTCYHGDSQDESSWNESFGGYQVPGSGRPARMGVVSATGDRYFLSADVSGFEPQEVVVLAYNQCVVIHAEKMGADGSVADKFTHKSQLPADMDPLSVSNTLTAKGMLVISVGRLPNLSAKSLTPVFHSETHL